jgi:hypothetical protein
MEILAQMGQNSNYFLIKDLNFILFNLKLILSFSNKEKKLNYPKLLNFSPPKNSLFLLKSAKL